MILAVILINTWPVFYDDELNIYSRIGMPGLVNLSDSRNGQCPPSQATFGTTTNNFVSFAGIVYWY